MWLCSTDWPLTHGRPPAIAGNNTRLKVCATMPGIALSLYFPVLNIEPRPRARQYFATKLKS